MLSKINELDNKIRTTIEPYFDEDYYTNTYCDIALEMRKKCIEPLEHFIRFGYKEKRNPSRFFNTGKYYEKFPELMQSDINPLYHYIINGMKEFDDTLKIVENKYEYINESIIDEAKKLFDSDYYIANNMEICKGKYNADTLFNHYIEYGWQEGRNPNESFSTNEYIAKHPHIIRKKINPLVHYVQLGMPPLVNIPRRTLYCSKFLSPNNDIGKQNIFDEDYYFSRNFNCFIGQEKEHYRKTRRNDFNPLFDISYYLKQISCNAREIDPMEHYLTEGWESGISPHPMFNVEFYMAQLQGIELNEPALLHYLTKGWRNKLSPHPLFDTQHYIKKAMIGDDICPLIHYLLAAGKHAEPHYLFNDGYYRTRQGLKFGQQVELLHYLKQLEPENISTHPYFEPLYYFQRLTKLEGDEQITIGQYKKEAEKQPLIHYVTKGWRLNLSPSPLFDNFYYQNQINDNYLGDPLRHFLTLDGFHLNSGHPAFDIAFYKKNAKEIGSTVTPAIQHFDQMSQDRRTNIHPFFDTEYYLENNNDIVEENLCPMEHFLRYGIYEGRYPNAIFNESYVLSRSPQSSFINETAILHYLRTIKNRPIRILFTSHEASRTGAPAIILRLIQDFSKIQNVECISILNKGGALLEAFKLTSFAYVTKKSAQEVGPNHPETRAEIRKILSYFSDNPPVVAICNSMASMHLAEYFHELGIPVISLIHEVPDYFPDTEFDKVYNISKAVVFPSKFVDQRARLKGNYAKSKISVRGQGLLIDRFGEMDRDLARRKVCKELGLPDSAFLVLGCGNIDLRKGVDYFCSTARKSLEKKGNGRPMYFLWVGGGDVSWNSPYHHLAEEYERIGIGQYIRFIGERKNVEPYFVAADAFLMTSRSDPFPCVVHEAMAAGTPIITFQEGGGACELVGDHGFSVALGDTGAMAEKVLQLMDDDALRMRIGEAAKKEIRTHWRSEEYCKYIQILISKVVGLPIDLFGKTEENRDHSIPIYFVTSDWIDRDVNTIIYNLIKGLIAKGYNAKIIFTRGRKSQFYYKNGMPVIPSVPNIFLQPEENKNDCSIQELLNWFKKASPCIVIPNYDYAVSYLSKILPSNIGIIGIAHHEDIENCELVYRLGHFWQRIVCVTKYLKDKICNLNRSFVEKTVTIHNGIDRIPDFNVEQKYQKPIEKFELVYSGHFEKFKNQIYRYVEFAEHLKKRNISFRLSMFGDDGEFKNISKEIGGNIPEVRFMGNGDHLELKEFMKSAHLYLAFSEFEDVPTSLLEAMSVGCVPLIFDMDSGIKEIVKTGINGFVVKDKTILGAVDLVSKIAQKPDCLLPLAKACRRTVFDMDLTVEGMTKKYINLVDEVYDEIKHGKINRSQFYHGNNKGWRSTSLKAELYINEMMDND